MKKKSRESSKRTKCSEEDKQSTGRLFSGVGGLVERQWVREVLPKEMVSELTRGCSVSPGRFWRTRVPGRRKGKVERYEVRAILMYLGNNNEAIVAAA